MAVNNPPGKGVRPMSDEVKFVFGAITIVIGSVTLTILGVQLVITLIEKIKK